MLHLFLCGLNPIISSFIKLWEVYLSIYLSLGISIIYIYAKISYKMLIIRTQPCLLCCPLAYVIVVLGQQVHPACSSQNLERACRRLSWWIKIVVCGQQSPPADLSCQKLLSSGSAVKPLSISNCIAAAARSSCRRFSLESCGVHSDI